MDGHVTALIALMRMECIDVLCVQERALDAWHVNSVASILRAHDFYVVAVPALAHGQCDGAERDQHYRVMMVISTQPCKMMQCDVNANYAQILKFGRYGQRPLMIKNVHLDPNGGAYTRERLHAVIGEMAGYDGDKFIIGDFSMVPDSNTMVQLFADGRWECADREEVFNQPTRNVPGGRHIDYAIHTRGMRIVKRVRRRLSDLGCTLSSDHDLIRYSVRWQCYEYQYSLPQRRKLTQQSVTDEQWGMTVGANDQYVTI